MWRMFPSISPQISTSSPSPNETWDQYEYEKIVYFCKFSSRKKKFKEFLIENFKELFNELQYSLPDCYFRTVTSGLLLPDCYFQTVRFCDFFFPIFSKFSKISKNNTKPENIPGLLHVFEILCNSPRVSTVYKLL